MQFTSQGLFFSFWSLLIDMLTSYLEWSMSLAMQFTSQGLFFSFWLISDIPLQPSACSATIYAITTSSGIELRSSFCSLSKVPCLLLFVRTTHRLVIKLCRTSCFLTGHGTPSLSLLAISSNSEVSLFFFFYRILHLADLPLVFFSAFGGF